MYIYLIGFWHRTIRYLANRFCSHLEIKCFFVKFFFLFEFLFSSKQEARKGFVVRRDSYMKLIKTKQQTIRKSKLKKVKVSYCKLFVWLLWGPRQYWNMDSKYWISVLLYSGFYVYKQKFLGFRKPEAKGFCPCSECLSSFRRLLSDLRQ